MWAITWRETNHILPSVWKSTTSRSRDVMFAFNTCDTASRVLLYPSYTLKFWDSEFRRDLANPEWIQPRSWAGAFVLWREVGRAQLVQPAEETAKFHCCLQSPKGRGYRRLSQTILWVKSDRIRGSGHAAIRWNLYTGSEFVCLP